MSKLIFSFCILSFCIFSCSIDSGILYKTEATIYLINSTSDTILSEEGCNRNIYPGDTLVLQEMNNGESSVRPNINNYHPFSKGYCDLFYDKSPEKCEIGIRRIENYEDRKEISPLVFEFTFRFTEEKKAKAEPCTTY